MGTELSAASGDGIRQAALPLLVATLTADPLLVSGLTFALMVPWLLFSLHAGALADRVDRRLLLILMSGARAILLGILAAAVVTGTVSIPLLYVVALMLGTSQVVFATSVQAVVPATVKRHELEPANARLAAAEIVGNDLVGPFLGAGLFALAIVSPFVAMIAFAVAGTLAAHRMRGAFRPVRDPAEEGQSLSRNIRSGLRWLAHHEVLRVVAVVSAAMAFVDTAGAAILVLYRDSILGLGELGFGMLLVVGGAGGITGSLLSGRIARGKRVRAVLLLSVALLMSAQFGLAVARDVVLAGASVFAGGFAYGLWGVVSLTLRQRLAPDALLARAGAGHRLLALGFSALGALAGGLVARLFGLRATYALGGLVLITALVAVAALLTQARLADAEQAAERSP